MFPILNSLKSYHVFNFLLVVNLVAGNGERFYQSDERPDIRKSPIPAWELIDTKKYATLGLQYSRGCPFDCEFCDIVLLNGRVPRTKDVKQLSCCAG